MKQAKTKHLILDKKKSEAVRMRLFREANRAGKKGNSLFSLAHKVWVTKSVVKLDKDYKPVPGDLEKRLSRNETSLAKYNHRLYKAIHPTVLRQYLANDWRMAITSQSSLAYVMHLVKNESQIPQTIKILKFYVDKTEKHLEVEDIRNQLKEMENKNEK